MCAAARRPGSAGLVQSALAVRRAAHPRENGPKAAERLRARDARIHDARHASDRMDAALASSP